MELRRGARSVRRVTFGRSGARMLRRRAMAQGARRNYRHTVQVSGHFPELTLTLTESRVAYLVTSLRLQLAIASNLPLAGLPNHIG